MKEKLQQIKELINKYDKILLFYHIHPDGDSLSSSYGLAQALRIKFPTKQIYVVGDANTICNTWPIKDLDDKHIIKEIDNTYLAIVGDVANSKRIAYYEEFTKAKDKIVFDHHKNNEPDYNYTVWWAEPKYPTSAMQAIEIIKELEIDLDEDTLVLLTVGLLTDTGNFTYSLNNSNVVYKYGDMIQGISADKLNNLFNKMNARNTNIVKLESIVLNKIKYGKQVAYASFNKKLINTFGRDNVKAQLNKLGNIEGFPIWVMVLEQEELNENGEPVYDISIRSNKYDISGVAKSFGGGCHMRASGTQLNSKSKIIELLNELDKIK